MSRRYSLATFQRDGIVYSDIVKIRKTVEQPAGESWFQFSEKKRSSHFGS